MATPLFGTSSNITFGEEDEESDEEEVSTTNTTTVNLPISNLPFSSSGITVGEEEEEEEEEEDDDNDNVTNNTNKQEEINVHNNIKKVGGRHLAYGLPSDSVPSVVATTQLEDNKINTIKEQNQPVKKSLSSADVSVQMQKHLKEMQRSSSSSISSPFSKLHEQTKNKQEENNSNNISKINDKIEEEEDYNSLFGGDSFSSGSISHFSLNDDDEDGTSNSNSTNGNSSSSNLDSSFSLSTDLQRSLRDKNLQFRKSFAEEIANSLYLINTKLKPLSEEVRPWNGTLQDISDNLRHLNEDMNSITDTLMDLETFPLSIMSDR